MIKNILHFQLVSVLNKPLQIIRVFFFLTLEAPPETQKRERSVPLLNNISVTHSCNTISPASPPTGQM